MIYLRKRVKYKLKKVIESRIFKEIISKNKGAKTYNNKYSEISNTIGPISTLEFMVESAFNFDKNQSSKMLSQIINLKKYIFRWRTVLGDGNCFFRAVIFSYFENLIFEKNITLLKHLCLEIDEKFSNENPLIKRLPPKLRNEYNLIDKNKLIIFNVLIKICNVLENSTIKDQTKCTFLAFEIFYESIIMSRDFDYMLIMYLRYKLYEYIDQNKDKIYHFDYQVKLGNLLPIEYEKSDNNFDFQAFIEKELLPLYKEAEMISIHLIPFVLKVDLVILTFDFINSSEKMKDFSCFLKFKHKIIVLYKRSHYDLIYDKNYFEKNAKYLTEYSNLFENEKCILTSEQLLDIEKSYLDKKQEITTEQVDENSISLQNTDPSNDFTLINYNEMKDINFNISNEEFKENLIKKDFESGNYKSFLNGGLKYDHIKIIAIDLTLREIKKDFLYNKQENESSLLKNNLNQCNEQICFNCINTAMCFKYLQVCKSCMCKKVLEVMHKRFYKFILNSIEETSNLEEKILYKKARYYKFKFRIQTYSYKNK